jgi:hypothetical protein
MACRSCLASHAIDGVLPNVVIPAKAGIHLDLDVLKKRKWIPAFAGMTATF